jgi:hypothetical protein
MIREFKIGNSHEMINNTNAKWLIFYEYEISETQKERED